MPLYEYACTQCGKSVTLLQKMSDAPAVDCPSCNTPGLVKQISAAGFRLKGGGWYETDFKSGSDTKRNLVEGGSDSSAKADKPAEKAAAAPAAPAAPAASSTS
ncbi:MAG: zinc ribbon domain-containing protein [Gammaproteobacteria bacterium]|jgi:putative FmdB family regulatory protein|nr:zinc ribbon domain-containing protein [Gammaproteobacteria bacterium]